MNKCIGEGPADCNNPATLQIIDSNGTVHGPYCEDCAEIVRKRVISNTPEPEGEGQTLAGSLELNCCIHGDVLGEFIHDNKLYCYDCMRAISNIADNTSGYPVAFTQLGQ